MAACPTLLRGALSMGLYIVPEDICNSPEVYSTLKTILADLEEQLALLDALGARVAAAHVSAAVEHLRLDLAADDVAPESLH